MDLIKTDHEENTSILTLGEEHFDVSILEIGYGTFEVLSTSGNNQLGGYDFDEVLATI